MTGIATASLCRSMVRNTNGAVFELVIVACEMRLVLYLSDVL